MRLMMMSAVVVMFLAATAGAIDLNPVADAFVTTGPTNNLVDNNYGGAGALSIAAAGLPKGEFRSFMRFDFAGAKSDFDAQFGAGNWLLQSATLRLGSTAPNNAIFNGQGAGSGGTNVNFAGQFAVAWMSDDTWIEGTGNPSSPGATGITFANQPSSATDQSLGSFAFPGGTSGTNTYVLSASQGFLADLAAGALASLRFNAADTGIAYTFNSRSGATPPILSLTAEAIPEPGATILVFTVSLLLSRRRH